MCAGEPSDGRLWSPPLSTRIMQSTLVASGYIQENIPVWLRLTAFEERERRCRGFYLSTRSCGGGRGGAQVSSPEFHSDPQ